MVGEGEVPGVVEGEVSWLTMCTLCLIPSRPPDTCGPSDRDSKHGRNHHTSGSRCQHDRQPS